MIGFALALDCLHLEEIASNRALQFVFLNECSDFPATSAVLDRTSRIGELTRLFVHQDHIAMKTGSLWWCRAHVRHHHRTCGEVIAWHIGDNPEGKRGMSSVKGKTEKGEEQREWKLIQNGIQKRVRTSDTIPDTWPCFETARQGQS